MVRVPISHVECLAWCEVLSRGSKEREVLEEACDPTPRTLARPNSVHHDAVAVGSPLSKEITARLLVGELAREVGNVGKVHCRD